MVLLHGGPGLLLLSKEGGVLRSDDPCVRGDEPTLVPIRNMRHRCRDHNSISTCNRRPESREHFTFGLFVCPQLRIIWSDFLSRKAVLDLPEDFQEETTSGSEDPNEISMAKALTSQATFDSSRTPTRVARFFMYPLAGVLSWERCATREATTIMQTA